ncbi:MAG: hypothetical protein HKN68_08070 [Saprospiraceae bacterium]|nr:hypothetical protein [Saprospiraceae bacterium]
MAWKSFLKELKRRHVYRVAVTYAIISWLILQIVSVIVPIIEAPEWMSKVVLILLIIGFPIALILAWAFDLTPEGIMRTDPKQPGKQKPSKASKTFRISNWVIGVLIFIVIAQFLYNKYSRNETTINPDIEKTIAVLPFKLIGNDQEGAYFADGVVDLLISDLGKIDELKVRSRTSVERFHNPQESVQSIAEKLNVNFIIEGSAQKYKDEIRIMVQLIDPFQDNPIWEDRYDRQYKDIFNVQSEIATRISNSLDVIITKKEKESIAKPPTSSEKAWDLYQRGLHLVRSRAINNIRASRSFFEQAIEIDSLFVDAYVALGNTYTSEGIWHGELSGQEAKRLAQPYYLKSLEIDPNNLQALKDLARTKYYYDWDFRFMDSVNQVLRKKDPRIVHVLFEFHLGRFDQMMVDLDEMTKVIPQEEVGEHWLIAYQYYFKNQYERVIQLMEEGLLKHPQLEAYYDQFGNLCIHMGKFDRAIDILQKGLSLSDVRHPSMLIRLAIAHYKKGEVNLANNYMDEVLERAASGEPEINVYISHYYAQTGEIDTAFDWLEKAYSKREVDLIWLIVEPNFEPLRNDSRYNDLIKRVGFPDA